MTLRTYIDRAIHDGTDFDAVISGCDVQQTFCWQPDMCITDACEAEYRALLDAEVRVLAAAPDDPIKRPHGPGAKTLRGRAFAAG